MNFQYHFGGTASIVADFKSALSAKYGKQIADFVFPSEKEQAASLQGLTKKNITSVLKQASILKAAHFLEYREVLEAKKQVASRILQEVKGKLCYTEAEKKYDQLQRHIENFNNARTDLNLSTQNLEELQRYFQEKVGCVNKLANEIVDLVNLSEEIAHFLEYREVLEAKKQVASRILQEVKGKLCYTEAEKKYDQLQRHIENFNNARTDLNLSTQNLEELQRYFQEKVGCVNKLANEIVDLVNLSEEIEKKFSESGSELRADMLKLFSKFNPELRADMLKVLPQHNQVMEELRRNDPSKLTKVSLFDQRFFIKTIEKVAVQLSLFQKHFDGNSSSYFYFNRGGELMIQDPAEANQEATQRSQVLAANVFFDALKQFYGATFVNQLRPEENQNQPLTVGQAKEIFKKIQTSFEELNSLLATQPLLITEEYLERLCSNEQLGAEAEREHAALGPDSGLLLRLTREAVDTPILGFISHFGIIVYHVTSAGTAIHCPPLLLAMAMSTVAGAIGGRIVARQQNEQVQTEAMSVAAVGSAGGTLGQIGSTVLENSGGFIESFLEAHIPLSSWLTSFALSYVGSSAAIATRNAFVGGNVSGALDAEENPQDVASSADTNTAQSIGEHNELINLEAEVSFENRLIRTVRLIMEAINQIPIRG